MDPTKVNSFDSNSGGNAGPQDFSENNPTNPSANGDIILVPDAQAQDSKNNKFLTTKMKIMIGIAVVMLIVLGVLAVVLAGRGGQNGGSNKKISLTTEQAYNTFANYVVSGEDDTSSKYKDNEITPSKTHLYEMVGTYLTDTVSLKNMNSEQSDNDKAKEAKEKAKSAHAKLHEKYEQYYNKVNSNEQNNNENSEGVKNAIIVLGIMIENQPNLGEQFLLYQKEGKEAVEKVFSEYIAKLNDDVFSAVKELMQQYEEKTSILFDAYMKSGCVENGKVDPTCANINGTAMDEYRSIEKEITSFYKSKVLYIVSDILDNVRGVAQ